MEAVGDDRQGHPCWKERLATAGLSLVLLVVVLWMRCCSRRGHRPLDRHDSMRFT